MNSVDGYHTLAEPSSEVLFKDRNSKFFGYAFPVTNKEDIDGHLFDLKKAHHQARHWCYAWQLGAEQISYRVNDDGEPTNSAGQPIYGQILSKGLTNVLVVVVRYFGGTKLGVGGLINAYRTAAQQALEAATIVERTIDDTFQLTFQYKDMSAVMRAIDESGATLVSQELTMDCQMVVAIRRSHSNHFLNLLKPLYEVDIEKLEAQS